MYEAFFGLREKPFQLTPDPAYLYLSQGHADVLTHLEYGVQENQGFVVITGEVGSGKTTLVQHLLTRVGEDVHAGLVTNTALPAHEFLRLVCDEFEVGAAGQGPAETLSAFNRFLVDEFAAGRRVVLIVDEAQHLPRETLEEVRLLSNLNTDKHFLLQVLLVGQPELRQTLAQPRLAQLRQRVTVQCHLTALRPEEVGDYVRHRLRVAGRSTELFEPAAMAALQRHSGGIPRILNALCHAALVAAFAEGRPTVGADLVHAVAEARAAGGTLEAPPAPGRPATPVEERLALFEARLAEVEDDVAALDERLTAALQKIRGIVVKLKTAIEQVRDAARARPEGPRRKGLLGLFGGKTSDK